MLHDTEKQSRTLSCHGKVVGKPLKAQTDQRMYISSQLYLPVTKTNSCVRPLLKCFEDIKSWLALNFLKLNEEKTEVMVFSDTVGSPSIDLGFLTQYSKKNISNLGIKMEPGLKFDCQIAAVVKSSFFSVKAVGQSKINGLQTDL